MEKTWLVWGIGLKTLEIMAISFDNAIDIARIINPNYCTAQLKKTKQVKQDTKVSKGVQLSHLSLNSEQGNSAKVKKEQEIQNE